MQRVQPNEEAADMKELGAGDAPPGGLSLLLATWLSAAGATLSGMVERVSGRVPEVTSAEDDQPSGRRGRDDELHETPPGA